MKKNCLVNGLLLFCLVQMLPLLATAGEKLEISAYIQKHVALLQTGQDYFIGKERVISVLLLQNMYQRNNFQPLWKSKKSVQQLLDAVQQSELEGLTPTDYHSKILLRLQQQQSVGMRYPTLHADFDLLLSDAFIRLAYDKSFGKVDPGRLNPEWNYPEKPIGTDLVGNIEKSIAQGKVAEALQSLSPRFSSYTRLKKALAQYREIRKQGNWPVIGSGQVLKPGMEDGRVPLLRRRLLNTGTQTATGTQHLYDTELEEAVIRFQERHYLNGDGIIGKQTLAVLNQSVDAKINQIRVNLERARWVLGDIPATVLLIDIAGYTLTYQKDSKVIWTTRVVVGKPFHSTPVFAAQMKYIDINPTWTIPRSIIINETLPKIQRDPSYLQQKNLRVLDSKGQTVNSAAIDWQSYKGKSFPYYIRQEPGPHNALGRIKFIFPNPHAIYLHDTPSRNLFAKGERAFSHGCIRVAQPLTLGALILQNDGQPWDKAKIEEVISSGKNTRVNLKTPLTVMLLYWTVNVKEENGTILFKQDFYGRDKDLLQALDGPFRFRDTVVKQVKQQG